MPELTLLLNAEHGLELPLACQHILQSVIYRALMDSAPSLATELHNQGAQVAGNRFKLFTFSYLTGSRQVEKGIASYRGMLRWDIRSPKEAFILQLKRGFEAAGKLRLQRSELPIVSMELRERTLYTSCARIRMLTPLTVHYPENGKTVYPTPKEDRFYELIRHNYRSKWEACYGSMPDADFELTPLSVTERHKCVTTYKQIWITGWYGEYRLAAPPQVLTFLYDCGLGVRSSQGFGMFQIV